MKAIVLLIVLAVSFGCATTESYNEADIKATILADMDQQAKDWSAGNLEGFMQGYQKSPDVRFAHPKGITRGWQTVMDRYAANPTKSRLEFSDVDITVLAADAALVFGRFHNYNEDPEDKYDTGLYTLLMRKIDGKWKIVHDHSSDLPDDWKGE